MRRTILTILMLASVISIISCGGNSPTSPSASYSASFTATTPTAGNNYVKMEQVSTSGDTVTIAVKAVSIAESAGGMAVYLTYDANRLSHVSTTNDGVFAGKTFLADDDGNGTIVVSASDTSHSLSFTDGTLFTVTLKGTTTGNGAIGFQSGANTLFNAGNSSISGISWYGGTASVQ